MPEYTVAAVAAPIVVVAVELWVLRTGLFRLWRYWAAIAIVLAFQVPVDGWLTRPEATIVHYHPDAYLGVRAPWHIPVEDFGFGFALATATLLLWRRWHATASAETTTSTRPPSRHDSRYRDTRWPAH